MFVMPHDTASAKLRHKKKIKKLWNAAEARLYDRFGGAPPEKLLRQLAKDRETWGAEELEISAFLGSLAALAAKNGWEFHVEDGFFACLVPYLFGAVTELPDEHLDGKAFWPWDCIAVVSEELFERIPMLMQDAFDGFYTPFLIDDAEQTAEQTWTLLPEDPQDEPSGRYLTFRNREEL